MDYNDAQVFRLVQVCLSALSGMLACHARLACGRLCCRASLDTCAAVQALTQTTRSRSYQENSLGPL